MPNASISRLRNLVFAQRAARLLLRAAWLFVAGYLLGWGLYARWGWLADTRYWLALGSALAAPALFAALRPLRTGRLARRIDHHLHTREQVTAAVRIQSGDQPPNRVETLLLEDAAALLREIFDRVWRLGWRLHVDAASALIIGVLLASHFLVTAALDNVAVLDLPPLAQTAWQIPPLAAAPAYDDIFPSGIPGLTDPLAGDPNANPNPASGEMTPEEAAALDNILSDLGEDLSKHPETADAGEALQEGDLEGAAAAIERIADNVDLLPDDARQDMQQALQRAARQARAAGQEQLAEDLERAAAALESTDPNNPLTADALDDLADGLRDLGETFASMGQPGEPDSLAPPENAPQVGSAGGESGAGGGQGSTGSPEPITRLDGQGDDFTIEGGSSASGLLAPGTGGDPAGTGGTPAAIGGGSPGETDPINSILTPYSFPWRWLSVVSKYFAPR
jgi:hypothetical protein